MSAHTPAPWKTRETATHIAVVGANNETLFLDDKRIPRVIEDARLIAAAPDLLEALIAVRDRKHTPDLWEMVNAAIAKATGAQQ